MFCEHHYGLLAGTGLAAFVLLGGGAQATTYDAHIMSSGLSGPATLVFDYNDGGPPDNTVVLNAPVGDWGPLPAPSDFPPLSICADATCPAPWAFTESVPMNCCYELQLPFSAIGTTLSFSFTTTDNAPEGGSFPDSFSFFLLNPDTDLPLFPTSDPSGALFLLSIQGIGPCDESLCVYPPDPAIPGFSMTVTPVTPAPEPGTLALLVAGFGALFVRRRLS